MLLAQRLELEVVGEAVQLAVRENHGVELRREPEALASIGGYLTLKSGRLREANDCLPGTIGCKAWSERFPRPPTRCGSADPGRPRSDYPCLRQLAAVGAPAVLREDLTCLVCRSRVLGLHSH
jgi:hypothetical protein